MSDAANNGLKGTGGDLDLDLPPNAADTPNAAHNLNIEDQVLRQFYDQSDKKPLGGVDKENGPELPDGEIPYGTIMGFCEDKFGVVCADSLVKYQHESTSYACDTAMKIVKVGPRIGLVGLGSQVIFSEVKRRVEDLYDPMAFRMKDVVKCLVDITTECVEECQWLYPDSTNHNVFYIVLGKMNEAFEMYTITNCHGSGRVVSERAMSRIVNGGSGLKPLSSYQNEKPPDTWVTESDMIAYSFKCMRHAVLEDKEHSGGDLNMVLINNDEYKPFVFRRSYVYGYSPAPEWI